MEENPFVYGKSVEGRYITDREEETKRLEANLTHGINTVLISPRRWGKTSLVRKVIANNKRDDIRYVLLDMFYCKSEAAFYHLLANEIISILENISDIGTPLPPFLLKLVEYMREKTEISGNIQKEEQYGDDRT